MRVILIGPPGVGKGTQAALLAERQGARQLSSGQIFREELGSGSPLGQLAKSFMERGELVPDSVTIDMMRKHIQAAEDAVAGFILDGFPRTVAQAEALDALLGEMGIELDQVVDLEVDDEEVVQRLSSRIGCPHCGAIYNLQNRPPKVAGICDTCGAELTVREDDRPETIRERLRVYHATTKPVIDYYAGAGRVHRVKAVDPESTYEQIVAALTR